jgi:hypothetical protein
MARTLSALGLVTAATAAGVTLGLGASPGSAEPIKLAKQPGVVRDVVQGDRWTAWTRCLGANGPSDVWVTKSASSPNKRVRGLRRRGRCDSPNLLGVFRNTLVVELGQPGKRRIVEVNVRTGRQRQVVGETSGEDGLEIVDADLTGRRIAWIQAVGPPGQREAQVVRGTVGRPLTRVLHRRTLFGGAVELVSVWVNARGEVAYREVLRGALYGYSAREERVELIERSGRTRNLASPAAGTSVVAADLSNGRFSYSIARDDTRRVWLFIRDLKSGAKRRVRVVLGAPPRFERTPPAVPAPEVSGRLTVWRERVPVKKSFNDAIRMTRGLALVKKPIDKRRDVRSQRWFVAPPSINRNVIAWAESRLPAAGGWRGGYFGVQRGKGRGMSTVYAQRVPR